MPVGTAHADHPVVYAIREYVIPSVVMVFMLRWLWRNIVRPMYQDGIRPTRGLATYDDAVERDPALRHIHAGDGPDTNSTAGDLAKTKKD